MEVIKKQWSCKTKYKIVAVNKQHLDQLRLHSKHPIVSGKKPSPLFWFTTSDFLFEKKTTVKLNGVEKQIPQFLVKPELVFERIWATAESDEDQPSLLSLID